MVTTPKNEQEAEQLREALAQFDTKRARETYDATVARFAPLKALVESPAYKEVRDALAALDQSGNFRDVDAVDVHLRNMPGFLDRLAGAVGDAMVPPAAIAAEVAADTPPA